jgi:phosphohistidine swiveling domain-containing protein
MSVIKPQPSTKLYKQEGKTGTFQSTLWALSVSHAKNSHVPVSWGEYFVFYKNNYLGVYWDENGCEKVVSYVLDKAKEGLPLSWKEEWTRIDREFTDECRKLVTADLSKLSAEELHAEFDRYFALDMAMWNHAIFIDTFDPGFDQARMKEIATEKGLSEEEVQVLVTPSIPAYITEWALALKEVVAGTMSREALREKFFWYATDYWQFGELTDAFIDAEIAKAHEAAFLSLEKEQKEILAKHGLSANPLLTFEELTTWRDIRKRLNYTGLYALMKLLREGLSRHGVDPELASAVLPHQAPDLFAGKISEKVLRNQFNSGVLLYVDPEGNTQYLYGKDAQDTWDGLDAASEGEHPQEVRGMTASRGKARGRVRIVPHITNGNAALMEQGDILVTSMTRPEFVPLMKIAGAIVTNEGGITSHAAIVSRELGIPCVIGTKIATKALREGDMVEVDADAGIVRKI